MHKNSEARERVLWRLLERGPSTVDELAGDLGVVPVTMRGHLSALHEQRLVEAENEHGRVGRPRRRYRLAKQAEALLPNRGPDLAGDLLECLQMVAGSRGVDQLLDVAAARSASQQAQAVAGQATLQDRVAAVAELLQQEGGLARWEETPERLLIRDFHCPYGDLAERRPEVCRYHTQVVTRLLGAPVALERSIARGDQHCLFAVARQPIQRPAAVRTLSDGRVAPNRPTS